MATFGFGAQTARLLAALRALGCRTCQFYRERGLQTSAEEACTIAENAGLRFDSMHGSFGEDLDPSSSAAEERSRCLTLYEEEGRLALDLGGPAVVVHPACFNLGRRIMAPAEAQAAQEPRWPQLDDFLRRLAEVGERLGVTYLIENQPRNCPLGHDPASLADRIRSVGSERIRMCLDLGHANMTGDPAEAIRACADVIAYLHIHDNDGVADQHLMPGDGGITWEGDQGVAAALLRHNIAAPRMLEVFYPPERLEALAAAGFAAHLRSMLAVTGDVP